MGPNRADKWQQYEYVQSFKDDPRSTIDGVNYARVIALYLYDRSYLHWSKMIAFALLFATRTTVSGVRLPLLNFYSYRYKNRADYDYIATYLINAAGGNGDFAESKEVFSVGQLWQTSRGFARAWGATAGYKAGLSHRISAAALISKYRSTAELFYRPLVSGRTRLVSFCDAAPLDNLLTQLAQANGAVTVTAQHGQYRVLNEDNVSIDAEAYANFVSDHLLCWGEATCAEFARFGVDRRRMVVTGWIRPWESVDPPGRPTGIFGVMLNGQNGAESNINLLRAADRISEELSLQFVVRLHPSDASSSYRSLVGNRCTSIDVISGADYVPAVDFSISHMSGATIEMLQMGSPVYALDDGHLADAFRVPGLSYKGLDALLIAIRADAMTSDHATRRTLELRRWFNDDSNQAARIQSAMLPQEFNNV